MSSSYDIRHAEASDIPALHELTLAVIRDGRGVVFTLEDAIAQGPRRSQRIHASLAPESKNDHLVLVATVGESVVGYASIARVTPSYTRHVGIFSLEVHPDHQRKGIGRSLLVASLDWANSRGIERVELYTRADNGRAQALYESEGFRLEGKRVRFIRLPDGTYVDDLVYVRFL